jgi:EthD domain
MLKVFAFLAKRKGLEPQAFRDYYENHHVPLICSLAPPPLVYKRNYLKRGDELNLDGGGAIGFDVVTEQVFADRDAFLAWVGKLSAPGTGERVRADEERFIDHAHYFAYVIEECVTTG